MGRTCYAVYFKPCNHKIFIQLNDETLCAVNWKKTERTDL